MQNQGLVDEVTCPYINLGPDQEERGTQMFPGNRCDFSEHSFGVRTYAQQRDFKAFCTSG